VAMLSGESERRFRRKRLTRLIRTWFFLFASFAIHAQDPATLSVTVVDPSNAVVPGAQLTLIDQRRGSVRQAQTRETGDAVFDHLDPGVYTLEAEKAGFDKIRLDKVLVAVRDRQSLHLEFRVSAAAQTTVTVTGEAEGISSDPAAGISVDSKYMENLPVNGRNANSLILMTPGITSAAGGRGGFGFNANGLRENTNYYTLDGVSLNASVGGGGPMGGPMGGGPPMGGGAPMGSGPEMISIDAMQEMRVQTSTFAPEFGRSPGAQISMVSRGGGNAVHGSLYYYFRNDQLNANDWFANNSGLPRGELRQNRMGGVLGGPLKKDRTFFFVSYEGLRLRTPVTVIADVPDLASRRSARSNLRPYLNAFPLPNGPELTDGAAQFRSVISNPSTTDSGSFRLDHLLTARWTLFVRYGYSTSSGRSRGSEIITPNVLSTRDSVSHTITTGVTRLLGGGAINDLRVNFSRSGGNSSSTMDDFGGAVPLTEDRMFPKSVTAAQGQFSLNVSGLAGYSCASQLRNEQQQINLTDNLTKTFGRHHFKTGLDLRYITPTYHRKPYGENITFRSLGGASDSLLSGVATNVTITANLTEVYPVYVNFSLYGQDAYRATERTTLTYGLRWDVNPAPGVRHGPRPLAVASDQIAGVTQNDPLYQTRWFDVAPRFGLAYQMDTTPGREMIFRSGAGLFYDMGYGMSAGAFNGAPYSSVRTLTTATFPLSASNLSPPTLPPVRPYGQIIAAERSLRSPRVIQFSAAVERMFGAGQSLTIGYSGTRGDRLLRIEMQPSFSNAYDLLNVSTNGATSSYNGLQVQFRRRLSATLQTQLSYTYSHSIDSASNDMGFGGGFATLFGGGERGSSDFDIRHNLNLSGSWILPAPKRGLFAPLLHGWYADWVITARTGLPFDVQGISSEASNSSDSSARGGLFAQVRPDYNGKPLWIRDSHVPGGQRLNADAFSAPSGYGQGNLGRNAIRGFPAQQVDLALRRQLAWGERLRLNLSAQAYNILNHPNFANPSPQEGANLSSPNFGAVTRMVNQSMGGGGAIYSSGGSRSLELALRLQF